MTAKDKAQELIITFGKIIAIDKQFKATEDGAEETFICDETMVKKCAIEAAREVITELESLDVGDYDAELTFWDTVIKEIEKI